MKKSMLTCLPIFSLLACRRPVKPKNFPIVSASIHLELAAEKMNSKSKHLNIKQQNAAQSFPKQCRLFNNITIINMQLMPQIIFSIIMKVSHDFQDYNILGSCRYPPFIAQSNRQKQQMIMSVSTIYLSGID